MTSGHLETFASGIWKGKPARFRCDRMIVSVRKGAPVGATLDAIENAAGATLENLSSIRPPRSQWAVFQFSPLTDAGSIIPQLAEQLAAHPDVRYAEPDFMCTGHVTPDDTLYAEQWWPEKIAIERLWKFALGNARVMLAILDSGISMSLSHGHSADHEDFNPDRFIVSHTHGGLPATHNYVPEDGGIWPVDKSGHGTHIAGIIGATGYNSLGVAGANWRSPVYIARVLDSYDAIPAGSITCVILAVHEIRRFARIDVPFGLFPMRARRVVINVSLGSGTEAEAFHEMCEVASGGQILICAAAESRDGSGSLIDFPAAFSKEFDHVISVGATDSTERIVAPSLDDYSAINIFAPGLSIMSTVPTYPCTFFSGAPPCYANMSGTSQACAVVSGVASLLWQLDRRLDAARLKEAIVGTAAMVATDGVKGYPRLDLSWLPESPPPPWHSFFP
jgi:serine protease